MFDVAVIGGGPAGTAVGALVRKYAPHLKVVIVEREKFPRDHVGESLLPGVCRVLAEMGVWDKVEAADFPIKIGGTYRWGSTDDLWDLDFLDAQRFQAQARPAKYEGQRAMTAFQVDRSIFDKILLDHCRELGCEVREQAKVKRVIREGDTVLGLELDDPQADILTARFYVDASGDSGILRRAMDVEVDSPTSLRNIAIWDYWQNAEWAVEIGVGGTRIQVLSLEYGWIWFIPLGPTRTSVGFVVPAQVYKEAGERPEEIYLRALSEEPRVAALLQNAHREKLLHTTKDWSFIANRLAGDNWFLVGDACGFADPILSAGMTLAQTGAVMAAYSIIELDRGNLDPEWLRAEYTQRQRTRISQHIRFADFWYSANGCFTDLKEYCAELAHSAGLELTADAAFQWLGRGGFANDDLATAQAAMYDVSGLKQVVQHLAKTTATWRVGKANEFRLDLAGAAKGKIANYIGGRVQPVDCFRREGKVLPLVGLYAIVVRALEHECDGQRLVGEVVELLRAAGRRDILFDLHRAMGALEALISQGWVSATTNQSRPYINVAPTPLVSPLLHPNTD